jgi:FAD/FMN-containing dehydrogenase
VVKVLRDATYAGLTVRAAGATHSHAPLLPTDGIIIDTDALSGLIGADIVNETTTFASGTRIFATGKPLLVHGLALLNQGDIDQQSLAGVIATGTHGTGPGLGNFSSALLAARVVLGDGSVLECSREDEPDLFEVVRLSLGAVGVITEVRLQARDAYRLRETVWLEPLDDVMGRIDELTAATRHFEFFWYPGKDRAVCKSLTETRDPPLYPLGAEGERLAWSFEVLPNVRNDKHTEMEYSLPAEHGPAALDAIRRLLDKHRGVTWPIEYRTQAADDIWISAARDRPTVTISIHEDVAHDEEAYYRDAEEIFLSFAGRPHWGKVNYLDAEAFADLYGDSWMKWWTVRDQFDPDRRFLNTRLCDIAPYS